MIVKDLKSNQQFNNAQRNTVNPKDLLNFLIKEVAMDSQVSAIVIQSEENKVVNMDVSVDEELERIFFPSDEDELAEILETYGKENNNE